MASLSVDKTLAIGIFTHGEIKVDDKGKPIHNQNCPEVHIKKRNVAGFACVSYSHVVGSTEPIKIHSLNYEKTRQALYCIDTCIDVEYYLSKIDCTYKYFIFHDPERACKIVDGCEYYEKEYSFDTKANQIIFIFGYNPEDDINIVTCSLPALKWTFKNYFSYPEDFDPLDPLKDLDPDLTSKDIDNIIEIDRICSEFIDERDKNKIITTTQLFNLIGLAKRLSMIDKVNILDTACNVVKKVVPDSETTLKYYSVNGNGYTPTRAFGGRKRKTRKKLRERYRRLYCDISYHT